MCGGNAENQKKPKKIREFLSVIFTNWRTNLLIKLENKVARLLRKNVVIAIDYENVKLTLRNRKDALEVEPDWGELIKLCAERGKITSKKVFAPMMIDYKLQEMKRRHNFIICSSIPGEDDKDHSEADNEMYRVVQEDIAERRRIDILIIVADDKHHAALSAHAIDNEIKVIVVEIGNTSYVLEGDRNIEIIPLPVRDMESKKLIEVK